jgi:D-alanyl-D-alanine dipeptidase
MSWGDVFDHYQSLLPEESLVQTQYRTFVSAECFTIAGLRIREIPICENGEKLVDLRQVGSKRIQMMPDPQRPFEHPNCNSGLPNGSKLRRGIFAKLEKVVEYLDALAPNFGYKPGQISIRVFEGLRDLGTQQMLFEQKLQEIQLARPEFSLVMAEQETSKWVAPCKNNVPSHSTGAAVDIRLWDEGKGDFLDMGPFGVIWGANPNAPTYSEAISEEQKRNRLLCQIAAERAGLTNYLYEFWHFSSQDRYAAYWTKTGEKKALYGSIQ